MPLSEELRTRRAALGLSQAQLAGRLGISQQTVSRWESGSAIPGPRRIAELAAAVGLNLSALFRSAGHLLAPDFVVDRLRPTVAEFEHMATTELVSFIDAGWQQLRDRLAALPSGSAPIA
jgi:transcriptional regulator with XRE-family HTH domain